MARDYAKYRSKKSISDKKNRYPEVVIIIFLLTVIVVSGYWVYIHKLRGAFSPNSQATHAVANLQSFFHRDKLAKNQRELAHAEPVAPKQEEVKFNFYDELPNMQVTVSTASEEKNPATVTHVDANAVKKVENAAYILHLGNFKDSSAAAEMRISLLLVGIDAEIIKVGDGYQLRQGNYATLARAKDSQKKLQMKGIDSTIVKN
jgi:cell division protein FtsN